MTQIDLTHLDKRYTPESYTVALMSQPLPSSWMMYCFMACAGKGFVETDLQQSSNISAAGRQRAAWGTGAKPIWGCSRCGKATKVTVKGSRVLPDTSSAQTTPSRSRAATREAMSSSLVCLCELGVSSAWLALRGFAALRCGDAGVFMPGKWKVKVGFDPADWKSGKVGTCPHLSVVT